MDTRRRRWTWFVLAFVLVQLAIAVYLDRTVNLGVGLLFILATWPLLRFLTRTFGPPPIKRP